MVTVSIKKATMKHGRVGALCSNSKHGDGAQRFLQK